MICRAITIRYASSAFLSACMFNRKSALAEPFERHSFATFLSRMLFLLLSLRRILHNIIT